MRHQIHAFKYIATEYHYVLLLRSPFFLNIKYTHDPITAANRKAFTRITEITGEAGSTQVVDSVAWFEERVSIENLDLIGTTATSDDQIICVLLKLGAVQLDWFV